MLSKHVDELHTLANALLEQETLTADEMRSLLSSSEESADEKLPLQHEALPA
jgi:ATP-dependent Zn protease